MEQGGITGGAVAFDVAVAVFLLLLGALGARAGFVKAVLSIVAWLAATGLAAWLYPIVTPYAAGGAKPDANDEVMVGGGLFVVLLALFMLAAFLVGRWFQQSDVGLLDRVIGFFFGMARGGFILTLAYLLAGIIQPPQAHPDWVRQAQVTPVLGAGADFMEWLAPDQVYELRVSIKDARTQAEAEARAEQRRQYEAEQQRQLREEQGISR